MKKMLTGAALCAIMTAPAFAQDTPSADTVLATVNGEAITLGHLIAMQQMLPEQYRDLPDEVLFDGMLEQLVQQQVLADAADDNMTPQMVLGLDNERRAFLAAMLMDEVAMAEVTAEALQAEYDAQFGSASAVMEYNASHILLETQEDAQQIITDLADGADFAELAQERSTGPSGPNGGELGWFSAGMMVPEFEQAVFDLQAGEVSEPVETQFGWHVVLLNETREQAPPSLDDVRAELEDGIRRARVDARMDELTAAAQIDRPALEIDASVIRNTDLLD